MKNKNLILSTASLVGTIIGAGIFVIPYVVSRSGVLISLIYLLIISASIVLLDTFFGEIILRTKEKHRLVGYAEKYLGKKAKILVTCSTIIGTVGSLLVYIILAGKFLTVIFPTISSIEFSSLFWAVLSFFVFLGINSIAPFEFFMSFLLFVVFGIIFIVGLPKMEAVNLIAANKSYILLPFGIFLFSLTGWNAIPEIEKILPEKRKLKKAIRFGVLLPAVFYFIFGLTIASISGQMTTKEPFSGLISFLGKSVVILGGIFGFLAVLTSFLILMNYLKNTLYLDYKIPYLASFLFASLTPFILFAFGLRQFVSIIAFVGTFVGLIEGTTIALIYLRVKQKGNRVPEYFMRTSHLVAYLIMAILFLGSLSQIIYYLSS